jgi:hypothetical protein
VVKGYTLDLNADFDAPLLINDWGPIANDQTPMSTRMRLNSHRTILGGYRYRAGRSLKFAE